MGAPAINKGSAANYKMKRRHLINGETWGTCYLTHRAWARTYYLKRSHRSTRRKHTRELRKDLLSMTGGMHAWESVKDGSRKTHLQKPKAYEGFMFYEFSVTQAQEHRRAPTHSARISHTEQQTLEEEAGPMALSEEALQWMTENGLEGLLQITDAPPHAEPE